MSKCDERFARQYRYEPPPEFPLALPYPDIVHHLSGPSRHAHTQTFSQESRLAILAKLQTVTFTARMNLMYIHLRVCVDSLVRVSRRVGLNQDNNTARYMFPKTAPIL